MVNAASSTAFFLNRDFSHSNHLRVNVHAGFLTCFTLDAPGAPKRKEEL
jgi:hypothetical protein